MSELLARTLKEMIPVDLSMEAQARARLDSLTKPRGSLGRLEDVAARLVMIARQAPDPWPARVVTVAADHGVAAAGVSPYPQEVTRQMVGNFLAGGAAVSVMSASLGVDQLVVDAGVAGEEFPDHEKLTRARVAPGTRDISQGPAMSREECVQALEAGVTLAREAARTGYRALGTGDMGIGNTTASAALYCGFLGMWPGEVVGPGAGLSRLGVWHKSEVVARALGANRAAIESGDPVEVLAALGGFEIACLAGLILGAAHARLPVVVDGYIATAAFVAAWKIAPEAAGYAFFAHASAEPGHRKVLEMVGADPLLDLGMRLGEGTGAVLGLKLLKVAADLYNNMATFEDAGVSNR
jgi:nicotinate-nucleotide--dimethylbenzimidazole phosphoribosyltransferase